MNALKLNDSLYWVGILDHDLRVFDIIMHTEFGTTYNSYVLKGSEKSALFESAIGDHVHFSVSCGGDLVDPESFLE